MDLVNDQRDGLTQHLGHRCVWIGEDGGYSTKYRPRADRNRVAVFGQQSSHRIDPGDTRRLPLRPHAMDGLERVLLDGLHRDRANVAAASGFQERVGIGPVRLIPPNVGPHVLHGQQPHLDCIRRPQ